MVININPNRINVQSGSIGKQNYERRESVGDDKRIVIPAKADVNTIPSQETLQTMIRSAVSALRQGTFWDRGTILNLVV